ncbi:IS3 family transposase [Streptomyces sp. NPDC054884]
MAGVISDNRTEYGIPHTVSCRALGVSESWFYKWRDRPPTGRELRRQQLADEIREIFTGSGGTYGSPKIFILLVRKGWRISVNTVAKLMAELGLVARVVKRRSGLTRPGKRPAAPDFVKRDFTAEEPDLVWAGDMTEIVTEEGKLSPRHGHRPVLPAPARLRDGCPPRRRPGGGCTQHGRGHPWR